MLAIWRLGESLRRLMECLTPSVSFDIFMDNYFTSFRLLTHLGANNIRTTRVFKKIGYANALSLGTNSCKKKERGHFKQTHIKQKSSVTWTRVG